MFFTECIVKYLNSYRKEQLNEIIRKSTDELEQVYQLLLEYQDFDEFAFIEDVPSNVYNSNLYSPKTLKDNKSDKSYREDSRFKKLNNSLDASFYRSWRCKYRHSECDEEQDNYDTQTSKESKEETKDIKDKLQNVANKIPTVKYHSFFK